MTRGGRFTVAIGRRDPGPLPACAGKNSVHRPMILLVETRRATLNRDDLLSVHDFGRAQGEGPRATSGRTGPRHCRRHGAPHVGGGSGFLVPAFSSPASSWGRLAHADSRMRPRHRSLPTSRVKLPANSARLGARRLRTASGGIDLRPPRQLTREQRPPRARRLEQPSGGIDLPTSRQPIREQRSPRARRLRTASGGIDSDLPSSSSANSARLALADCRSQTQATRVSPSKRSPPGARFACPASGDGSRLRSMALRARIGSLASMSLTPDTRAEGVQRPGASGLAAVWGRRRSSLIRRGGTASGAQPASSTRWWELGELQSAQARAGVSPREAARSTQGLEGLTKRAAEDPPFLEWF